MPEGPGSLAFNSGERFTGTFKGGLRNRVGQVNPTSMTIALKYLTGRWFSLKERFRGSRGSGRTGSWKAKAKLSRLQEDGKRQFSGEF